MESPGHEWKPATEPAGRLRALDIARGFAAMAVYVFHVQLMVGFDKRHCHPCLLRA